MFEAGGVVKGPLLADASKVFIRVHQESVVTKKQFYELSKAIDRISKCFKTKNTLSLEQFIRRINGQATT